MPKIGLMIPEFPGQTHIAMWRVGQAIREIGIPVQFLSTRRNLKESSCHQALLKEAEQTHYLFPPQFLTSILTLFQSFKGLASALIYIIKLPEGSVKEKLRCLPLLLAAADLKAYCDRQEIDHVFVHSCANAAHVAALCYHLGGPSYSLRLGGDLEVYGDNHAAKMGNAAFIAAAAKPTRQQVLDQVGLAPDRVYSIWLGVDTQRFVPPSPGRQPQANRLRLVTVARLNVVKGFEYSIQAVRQLLDQGIDVEYKIAGSGPHEAPLRQLVKQLNLQDYVHFLGSTGEQQVIQLLQSSDVFVLASVIVGEASPVAVLEGMACGLPAVCTIIGGTPDIVDDGKNGFLVNQQDADALADRLARLAHQVELRTQMGEAAREKAVQQFDCRLSAKQILKAIETHTDIQLPVAD